MSYNLSLNSINLNNKKHYYKIHHIGTSPEFKFNTIKYVNFLIFQISNFGDNENLIENFKFNKCVYLPVRSIYENIGIYYNMFFQKQISYPVQTPMKGVLKNSTVFDILIHFHYKYVVPFEILKKFITKISKK